MYRIANALLIPELTSYTAEKQPSNPYHTQTIFNSQALFTSIIAVGVINANPIGIPATNFNPSSPQINRFLDIGPGNNHTQGVSSQGRLRYYYTTSTYTGPTPQTDMIPGDAPDNPTGGFFPSPKAQVSKMRCVWQKTDQSSPYMSVGMERKPSSPQDFSFVRNQPTPAANPRSPSTDFAVGGGAGPPYPGTGGNWAVSHCVLYNAQLTKAEIAEQWDEWRGYNNNSALLNND